MSEPTALVRSLLLPLSDENFVEVVAAVDSMLESWSIDKADRATFIQNQLDSWRETGRPPKPLRTLILAALAEERGLPGSFSAKYFPSHLKLQSRNHLLTFDQARGLLSNTLLVGNLLSRERMSAAQVALVLNASQNTASFTWRHVQVIADALGLRPSLDLRLLTEVHESDVDAEPVSFADANPRESIAVLASRAAELGYRGDMADQLERFLDESDNFESAFAIVLHANALVTQFFDHPLSQAVYEFEPRGGAISDVMREAHPSYQASESAYLNNAKGTFAFDSNWAWGRKEGNRRQAHALVQILDGLGEMAYHPRRELAGWVRQWLLRMERARSTKFVRVGPISDKGIASTIARIKASNTATHGVLEQRLIDLVATRSFSSFDGWRLRGVGDSVNASNVAKRKLGDIEAENASRKEVIAFEPHGGKLSEVYVDRHRGSLAQVLTRRIDEFQLIAPPDEWRVRVVFIAHDVSALTNFKENLMGFEICYEFETYESFLMPFSWDQQALDLFAPLVAGPIDQPWIPDSIKATLNSAMS